MNHQSPILLTCTRWSVNKNHPTAIITPVLHLRWTQVQLEDYQGSDCTQIVCVYNMVWINFSLEGVTVVGRPDEQKEIFIQHLLVHLNHTKVLYSLSQRERCPSLTISLRRQTTYLYQTHTHAPIDWHIQIQLYSIGSRLSFCVDSAVSINRPTCSFISRSTLHTYTTLKSLRIRT